MCHQNPDKSNNLNKMFFKQNVFNEKLNITKSLFTYHLGDPSRAQLFDIFPINLNDGLYSRSEAFARCSAVMSTNAASITVLNDVIGMPKLVCDPFNYAPYVIIQGI